MNIIIKCTFYFILKLIIYYMKYDNRLLLLLSFYYHLVWLVLIEIKSKYISSLTSS